MEFDEVSPSIHFPAFVFLLLLALLLLLSEQFSRFSAPRSMLESGKAIDRAAVETATLIDPQAVTKRDLQLNLAPVLTEIRRHLSFIGLFPHPIKINVSANEERVVSFVDAALSKITRKFRGAQIRFLRVDALPTSRPILERYGFRQLGSTWPADWPAP